MTIKLLNQGDTEDSNARNYMRSKTQRFFVKITIESIAKGIAGNG